MAGEIDLVSGMEIVVREVGRWEPTDIAFVRRVTFENGDWSSRLFDLALIVLLQPRPRNSEGWPDPAGKYWEVEIVFRQVRDLTLTVCGPWDFQTPGFELLDIRDRQWEGIKLLVSDYEHLTQEGIKFGAKSASIRFCRLTSNSPRSLGFSREYPGVMGGSD